MFINLEHITKLITKSNDNNQLSLFGQPPLSLKEKIENNVSDNGEFQAIITQDDSEIKIQGTYHFSKESGLNIKIQANKTLQKDSNNQVKKIKPPFDIELTQNLIKQKITN